MELDTRDKLDIGKLAIWSVSSSKFGHGLEMLRDNNLDTFWHKLDESYTPQIISIRGGTDFHDLKELVVLELDDLSGWTNITLQDAPGSGKPPQVFLLQLAVLANQQNGKDTHIRQLKIFSAKE
ncbi:Anaphase-promoting complex subunit 10 [Podila epigama]|nr:Anaphase-promoting complex subunit 10 [Podila epigama]